MKRDLWFVACVILAGAVVFIAAHAVEPPAFDYAALAKEDLDHNRTFWSERIRTLGAGRAYASFKKANEIIPPGRRHLLAHVFGSALYASGGVEGIAICDPTFGFGCFHGFFVAAVKELGPAAIRPLDDECVKAFGPLGTGCQHGIGHGILEYLGHDELLPALKLCGHTTETVPLLGCSSGVYMEYFIQTGLLTTATTSTLRPLEPDAPYGPCASVPATYQAACYWALPDWWQGAIDDMTLGRAASLCAELPSDARQACYLGIGNLAPAHGSFESVRTASVCDALGGEARVYCRAGAAWHFFSVMRRPDLARGLCSSLQDPERKTCLHAADYTNGLDPHAP